MIHRLMKWASEKDYAKVIHLGYGFSVSTVVLGGSITLGLGMTLTTDLNPLEKPRHYYIGSVTVALLQLIVADHNCQPIVVVGKNLI